MENKYNEKEPLVTVKNLEVCYTSGKEVVRAVNNVSFRIMESETLGLVGETGAGKTTIAKSIMSILPDPPAKVKNGEIIMQACDYFHVGFRVNCNHMLACMFQNVKKSCRLAGDVLE